MFKKLMSFFKKEKEETVRLSDADLRCPVCNKPCGVTWATHTKRPRFIVACQEHRIKAMFLTHLEKK